jgi:hypothetical protein
MGSPSNANGVRDAPIVDSSTQKVYAFQGADANTVAPDSLGAACGSAVCNAVYQFSTTFASGDTGSRVFVGQSGSQNDLNRSMNAGAFDETYYSSSGTSGFLYVCGSAPAAGRRATLWKITITANSFSAKTLGPQLVDGDSNDGCSPVTVFDNGGSENLYVSVNANAAALGGGGCTQVTGCAYLVQLPMPATWDTTSAPSPLDGTTRFMSVSTSTALNTNETIVQTTLTSNQAGKYRGMFIDQQTNSPAGTTFQYTLMNNAADTAITCSIGPGTHTCTDAAITASTVAGDKIDVKVQRTAGTGTLAGKNIRVLLGGVSAALNATGGTGGIIIDNSATGGGSQIYYSTRTSPGIAVQASQADLN